MSEKNDKRNETFREYLMRRLLPHKPKAAKHLVPWDENRGGGIFYGKNARKREARAGAKVDRAAHIRWNHGLLGNGGRTPKLKRVPAAIFE